MSPCMHVQLTSFKFIYLIVCNCALNTYIQIVNTNYYPPSHSHSTTQNSTKQCEQFFAIHSNQSSAICFFPLIVVGLYRESIIFLGFQCIINNPISSVLSMMLTTPAADADAAAGAIGVSYYALTH